MSIVDGSIHLLLQMTMKFILGVMENMENLEMEV